MLAMIDSVLQQLETKGLVLPGSRVDLAVSPIDCAVKAGDEVSDIHDDDSFRRTLLVAKSIVYSDSASGEYIQTKLFKKLDIESEMKGKACQIPTTPVCEIIQKVKRKSVFRKSRSCFLYRGSPLAASCRTTWSC